MANEDEINDFVFCIFRRFGIPFVSGLFFNPSRNNPTSVERYIARVMYLTDVAYSRGRKKKGRRRNLRDEDRISMRQRLITTYTTKPRLFFFFLSFFLSGNNARYWADDRASPRSPRARLLAYISSCVKHHHLHDYPAHLDSVQQPIAFKWIKNGIKEKGILSIPLHLSESNQSFDCGARNCFAARCIFLRLVTNRKLKRPLNRLPWSSTHTHSAPVYASYDVTPNGLLPESTFNDVSVNVGPSSGGL